MLTFEIRFSGGLSNELYICSLPEGYPLSHNTPQQVVLRIYGCLYGELVGNTHALALLSERKVGPKLYAIFPEGRLEQFLPVS